MYQATRNVTIDGHGYRTGDAIDQTRHRATSLDAALAARWITPVTPKPKPKKTTKPKQKKDD